MLNEILREKRNELGLTQQEIADRLNVTRQTVSSWEVGKSIPDISSLIDLSELYDISLDYMLKGDKQVTDKLKEDTVELKFLRFFSKTTLIVVGILLAITMPALIIFAAAAFIYITVFKKQNIKIITSVRESNTMKKSSSSLGQALTDSFSIIGGMTMFYIMLSFFIGKGDMIVNERNKIVLIILFIGFSIGGYFKYRRNKK
ncbi:helix-turn-helix transcriptional regulator [Granulicatella seriolae]|uniref:Helix-turn-helix domain-containing protein n=1 Tax=Granulicatella seriolae TaxID=2967226 RepID=A0ABT1WP05_9LACT|nr:helix-turn-helix transcriptional regulator [Granulicatella seriolae]